MIASIPKFAFFGFELEQFERFGLPFPGALVFLAGVLELLGGLALVRRRFVGLALLLLIPTMLVAIVASGVLHGDVIPSLTVAPALLVALLLLVARSRPPAAPRDRPRPSRRSSPRRRSPGASPDTPPPARDHREAASLPGAVRTPD